MHSRGEVHINNFDHLLMVENNMKSGRGGARPGAGRPRKEEESKLYTFRASGDIARFLDAQILVTSSLWTRVTVILLRVR